MKKTIGRIGLIGLMLMLLLLPGLVFGSQYDMDISTADANTGTTYRSAVNTALKALVSLSSGASAPSTTYAYQLWADTSTNKLKLRNSTNTAWLDVLDLTDGIVFNADAATTATTATNGNPVGAMLIWPAASAPSGYLLCDGTAVSRTTYATLFALIGTTYGVGDGATTFNLPNLKGKVPAGFNSAESEFDALGETGGEKTHVLSTGELAGDFAQTNATGVGGAGTLWSSGAPPAAAGGHNNLQPYITLNYIIKY